MFFYPIISNQAQFTFEQIDPPDPKITSTIGVTLIFHSLRVKISNMKQVIKRIRISELSEIVKQMGINQNTMVDFTSETTQDNLLAIMDLIAKEAHENGLTEEILAELLADDT